MTLSSQEEEKYDRQLRLWGRHGQKKLERAHFCALGTGPDVTEALKNIILPGIRHFTIIDSSKVTAQDLSNNFFVTEKYIGNSRASAISCLLCELNNDVLTANCIDRDPVDLIEKEADFVAQYSFIIASYLPESALLKLADSCLKHQVPLIVIRIYGLIGFLRLQFPEQTVIESKPEFLLHDLRLSDPFPELLEYANKVEFLKLSSTEHAHIPFPVILIHAMKKWREKNKASEKALPSTNVEKAEYKQIISNMSHKLSEENFSEAIASALNAYIAYKIPEEVKLILDNPKAKILDSQSSNFWIVVWAIRKFVENEGQGKLPLLGTIPDMTTETASFIELQKIYLEKAQRDCLAVAKYTNEALQSISREPDSISLKYISYMCRNSMHLRVICYRAISEEYSLEGLKRFSQILNTSTNTIWYFLTKAADHFRNLYGHFPGSDLSKPESVDLQAFNEVIETLQKKYGITGDAIAPAYVKEFLRYGGSQIHNIGAILGGVCAQEIIKITTQQWIPLNNTFVFNGITNTSSVYEI